MNFSRSKRSRRNHGGIMVEAMMALFLFTLCGLTCISLLLSSVVASRRAVENNQAYNAARQVIENVRLFKSKNLVAGNYAESDVVAIGAVPQLTELTDSDVTMVVSDWNRKGVKYVRVTVRWQGNGGNREQKERVLTSLVAEGGVTE